MLIGIALGLVIKKGGIDKVAILSIGIFLFYWITLVTGEKSADRGELEPWIGMWGANIVIGLVALLLLYRIAFGNNGNPFTLRRNLNSHRIQDASASTSSRTLAASS